MTKPSKAEMVALKLEAFAAFLEDPKVELEVWQKCTQGWVYFDRETMGTAPDWNRDWVRLEPPIVMPEKGIKIFGLWHPRDKRFKHIIPGEWHNELIEHQKRGWIPCTGLVDWSASWEELGEKKGGAE